MELHYLFLILSNLFMSLEFVLFEYSTENTTLQMLIGNLIFSCGYNLGLLQNASYLEPSSKCTLITRPCDMSVGIAADYTVS